VAIFLVIFHYILFMVRTGFITSTVMNRLVSFLTIMELTITKMFDNAI